MQWVYIFGGQTETQGNAQMRELLGGKGANLAEMSRIGLAVPPGFTITTEVCTFYYEKAHSYPDGLDVQIKHALDYVEQRVGKQFGDPEDPLLLSVRSGARASMPGMMDTVLNLGLNDATAEALAKKTNNPRFAYDSYRRFIQMYSDVVLGIDHAEFEDLIETYKENKGHVLDTDLDAADWLEIIGQYKAMIMEAIHEHFPQDPQQQLYGAIGAVFKSWMSARAITYRHLHDLPTDWGTAVNVQAMVFGNRGDDSATGVAFTRDPSMGEKRLYGEFLVNAQGEDVVSGIRTPQDITEASRIASHSDAPSLETIMPKAYSELVNNCAILEKHYRDMQDLEFTIEEGKLWMLQTRNGKRTAKAALKIAVDMANEGLITHHEAIQRIEPHSLDQLLHPVIDPNASRTVLASGLPASPGAACGEIVFSSHDAERLKAQGKNVILVRIETSPEDIHGMHAADGILTTRGGMTSHAAVVARGMGTPCVSGVGTIRVHYMTETMSVGAHNFNKGDVITIDGTRGQIFAGEVAMLKPELSDDFNTLMGWADENRRMKVRANAETPADARVARAFGAEGIGLCRTEHMFFQEGRIVAMREMILADTEDERRTALDKLLPIQRRDFIELFEIMHGLPVTIRLLDPPLHEFLPKTDEEIAEVAEAMAINVSRLKERLHDLHETNPMLGHRGCRLAISYPEIAEMQARAIFEAAIDAGHKTGEHVVPEIMVPLVGLRAELDYVKAHIDSIAQTVSHERGTNIVYYVGTMIELPRAALCAADIAEVADFFSFGTNDLTQTTFGISRDDAARFIGDYQRKGVITSDPFVSLDVEGVGSLMQIATERGQKTNADIKLGICGEHGGDPKSIHFCEQTGLHYISCSPFRVPIARLSAAQATLHK